MVHGKPFIAIFELLAKEVSLANLNENYLKINGLGEERGNLRLLRSLTVKAYAKDSQNPKKGIDGNKKIKGISGIFPWIQSEIRLKSSFIKALIANYSKSISYTRINFLCTDIHWHLRTCLTVMWLATRPYKHEQICSMTARLCLNIY